MKKKLRKSFCKKCLGGLIILILAIGITGCSSQEDTPKKVDDTNTSEKTNDNKKNEPSIFKVGDTVELKNFKVTVNKLFNVKGNEFSKPQEGNEFIAVDCTLENISDKDQAVSSMLMFKVVDKDGRTCEYSLLGQAAAKAGQLDGNVAPGRKMTGAYVVEVPKGTTGLELEFDNSFLRGSKVIIQLN